MLDLLIIGGAAAGSAAAIYASRAELTLKLVSMDWGGEVARSGEVWNYPSHPETNGIALSKLFREHVNANKVDIDLGIEVTSVTKQEDGTFVISGKKGSQEVNYQARTVIVATGVHPRPLTVPGEDKLKNRGLSYCTVCDGPLYRNKEVIIVGGGNSALEAALMMANIASKVTVLTINGTLEGEAVYVTKVNQDNRITVITDAQTTEVVGEQSVSGLRYIDKKTNQEKELSAQGIFVHIGLIPNSGFLPDVKKNDFNEIIIDDKCHTNIDGLFAAGDVTSIAYKQIVISAGHGATAALSAINYLNKMEPVFH